MKTSALVYIATPYLPSCAWWCQLYHFPVVLYFAAYPFSLLFCARAWCLDSFFLLIVAWLFDPCFFPTICSRPLHIYKLYVACHIFQCWFIFPYFYETCFFVFHRQSEVKERRSGVTGPTGENRFKSSRWPKEGGYGYAHYVTSGRWVLLASLYHGFVFLERPCCKMTMDSNNIYKL